MLQQENRPPSALNVLPYARREHQGLGAAVRTPKSGGLLGSSPLVTVKTSSPASEAPSPEARAPLSPLDNLPPKPRSCTPEVSARIRGVSPGHAKALALGEAKFQEFKARKARASRSPSPGPAATPASASSAIPSFRHSATPSPAPSNASVLSSRTALSRASTTPQSTAHHGLRTELSTPASLPSASQNRSFASSTSTYAGLSPLPAMAPFTQTPLPALAPFTRTPPPVLGLTPEQAKPQSFRLQHPGPAVSSAPQTPSGLSAAAFEDVAIDAESEGKENVGSNQAAHAAGEASGEASKNWSYRMKLPLWPVTVTMGVAIDGKGSAAGATAVASEPLDSICCHTYLSPGACNPNNAAAGSRPSTPSGMGNGSYLPPQLPPLPTLSAPVPSKSSLGPGGDAACDSSRAAGMHGRAEQADAYQTCALFAVAPSSGSPSAAQHSTQPQFQSNPLFDEPASAGPPQQPGSFRFAIPSSLPRLAKQASTVPDTPRVGVPITTAEVSTGNAAATRGASAGGDDFASTQYEVNTGPIPFASSAGDADFSFDLGECGGTSNAPAMPLAAGQALVQGSAAGSGIQHMASMPSAHQTSHQDARSPTATAAAVVSQTRTSAQIRAMFSQASGPPLIPRAPFGQAPKAAKPATAAAVHTKAAGDTLTQDAAEKVSFAEVVPELPTQPAATAHEPSAAHAPTGAPAEMRTSAPHIVTPAMSSPNQAEDAEKAREAVAESAPQAASPAVSCASAAAGLAPQAADVAPVASTAVDGSVSHGLDAIQTGGADKQLVMENEAMRRERDELRDELRRISERLAVLETMAVKAGPKGRSRSAPRKAKGQSRPASPFLQPMQQGMLEAGGGQGHLAGSAGVQHSAHPSMRAGSTGRIGSTAPLISPFQALHQPPGIAIPGPPPSQGSSVSQTSYSEEVARDQDTGSEQSSFAGLTMTQQDSFASEVAHGFAIGANCRRRRNRRGRSNTPPPYAAQHAQQQPSVPLTQPSAALFTKELPHNQPGRPDQEYQGGRSRSNGRRRNRSATPDHMRSGPSTNPYQQPGGYHQAQHAQQQGHFTHQRPQQGGRYASPNLMPAGPWRPQQQMPQGGGSRPNSRNRGSYAQSYENANPNMPDSTWAAGAKASTAADTAAMLGINLTRSDFQPQAHSRPTHEERGNGLRATAAPFRLLASAGNTQGQLR